MRLPSAVSLIWKARSLMSGEQRRRVRQLADVALAPIGSIQGGRQGQRSVALTFDDGPDPFVTPGVLDLLAANRARATFFVLMERALRQPALIRRMLAEEHEVGLHADRHDRLTTVSAAQLHRRLTAARHALESITGQEVRWFRPPYGSQSLASYLVARRCGLDVVVWGPYAEDWVERGPEVIAARGLQDLADGDILLLHDGLELPAGEPLPSVDRLRVLELILHGLRQRGLRSVTVSTLTGHGARRTAWFRP